MMADQPYKNNKPAMQSFPYRSSKTLRAAYRRVFTRGAEAGSLFYRHAQISHASMNCQTQAEYDALCATAKPLGYCITQQNCTYIKMKRPFVHHGRNQDFKLNWLEINAPSAVSEPGSGQKTRPTHLVFTGNDFEPPREISLHNGIVLRYQTLPAAKLAS